MTNIIFFFFGLVKFQAAPESLANHKTGTDWRVKDLWAVKLARP